MHWIGVVLCLYSVTVVLVLVVTSSVLGTGDQELPGAASSPLQRPVSQHIHIIYTVDTQDPDWNLMQTFHPHRAF